MSTPTKLKTAQSKAGATSAAATNAPPPQEPKRLVVETNRRTAGDLAWLVEVEELNKTTIVNRAVQVYRMIVEAQRKGGGVVIEDPEKGKERVIFM